MHKSIHILIIAALLASATANAQQQASQNGMRYKWVDDKGLPHFSDSLTDDAIKYGYSVVNDQGMTVQRVQRTLSPAERAAAQKQAAQLAAQQRAARDRARTDEQLLAAYPDEASYKSSLDQTLANMDLQLHTSKLNLRSQEQSLTGLLARASEFEHNKQPLPKFLQEDIAKQRALVNGLQTTLTRQQTERDATAKDQAQQLAHYRALQAAQNTPP